MAKLKKILLLKNIKGILSDIDGTLYFKEAPVKGAIDAVNRLQKRKKMLFLTNTDSQTPKTIQKKLLKIGFSIQKNDIFTPIIALKNFLQKNKDKKIFLVANKEIEKEFKKFNIISKEEIPDFVIISDFSDDWNVHRLNEAFNYLLNGAKLLGTQGNRYCLDKKGQPVIDTGSFVRMLSNAACVPYKIFGKPSKEFFNQALNKIGLKPEECIVVGDDIESDISGAINAGIKPVLVKTGKAANYENSDRNTKPFLVINDFKTLLKILE